MDYTKHVNPRRARKVTPQSRRIPGREDQVVNNAGGYAFPVSDWDRLDRFLVLGTEGGTYYVGERSLTKDNAKVVERLLKEDGVRVVRRVVDISYSGRAPKNDPALFVLAMASAAEDLETRKAALAALPTVARIGTHLFHYAQFVEAFRGWGRGLRKAVAAWYNDKSVDNLIYQLIKYKARDGWSHRDLLRLAHPKTSDEKRNDLYKWVVDKDNGVNAIDHFARLAAAEQLATEKNPRVAVRLIEEYNLPREVVNTELLNNKKVWGALLQKMPMTAMIRNLGKMTSVGLLDAMSDATQHVCAALTDADRIAEARIHPLAALVALKTYTQGCGFRGKLQWSPVQTIVDCLDRAFYLAFKGVEPTGKRLMLALDVSGSMTSPDIAGMPGISPRVGSAAMALVTAAVENRYMIKGFSSSGSGFYGRAGDMDGFIGLDISPRMRLDMAVKNISRIPFGGTDCALPMLWAAKNKVDIDAFVIYTDSETWAGKIHPTQALDAYRQRMGIPAKLIVVGTTSTGFSIADPNDGGMLDVVGFDTAAPNVMSDFIKGE